MVATAAQAPEAGSQGVLVHQESSALRPRPVAQNVRPDDIAATASTWPYPQQQFSPSAALLLQLLTGQRRDQMVCPSVAAPKLAESHSTGPLLLSDGVCGEAGVALGAQSLPTALRLGGLPSLLPELSCPAVELNRRTRQLVVPAEGNGSDSGHDGGSDVPSMCKAAVAASPALSFPAAIAVATLALVSGMLMGAALGQHLRRHSALLPVPLQEEQLKLTCSSPLDLTGTSDNNGNEHSDWSPGLGNPRRDLTIELELASQQARPTLSALFTPLVGAVTASLGRGHLRPSPQGGGLSTGVAAQQALGNAAPVGRLAEGAWRHRWARDGQGRLVQLQGDASGSGGSQGSPLSPIEEIGCTADEGPLQWQQPGDEVQGQGSTFKYLSQSTDLKLL